MNLQDAVCYDCETFPNAYTLRMELLNGVATGLWEISEYRDDRHDLMMWLNHMHRTQTPMIGFNNVHFDYPILHYIFMNPQATVEQIYTKAMSIINGNDNQKFAHTIWPDDRIAPQVDLFKLHHFDNKAKSTNLKALQINMRSPRVVDMPVPVGTVLTKAQVDHVLIPYGNHDVSETKQFAHHSMEALNFRCSLVEKFGPDVMNWPDTKIGSRMMEDRLGRDLCYEQRWISTGSNGEGYYKKAPRQTPRARIDLSKIIFPYVQFEHPEFNRILDYFKSKVLTIEDIEALKDEENSNRSVKTKGIFTDLKATVGGIDFYFGTGGIHGSVSSHRIIATDEWLIRDIDVAALYPSIAIVNRLYPEHLGEKFIQEYGALPKERKRWQELKGKKCVEANSYKLASNGVYGNSNNQFSVFYDPQYTLTITINGQLMLCMLAERLLKVPTLRIIQINTDGITYYVHKDYEPHAAAWCKEWQALTALVLEDTNYKRMWIRDVNSYIAESMDGSLKLKGAYWTPDPLDYYGSISAAQPPAWHKDLGNVVSIRAAVAAMVHGVDPVTFIRLNFNPYDFMCRIKVRRGDQLMWGNEQVQRNTRYYISTDGRAMVKISPPSGPVGAFKCAPKVSAEEYRRVMKETGGAWDPRVCTKNKSVYENRATAIEAGFKVTVVNDVAHFNFSNLNYDWYVNEARKLII